jgi:hypothetical protein
MSESSDETSIYGGSGGSDTQGLEAKASDSDLEREQAFLHRVASVGRSLPKGLNGVKRRRKPLEECSERYRKRQGIEQRRAERDARKAQRPLYLHGCCKSNFVCLGNLTNVELQSLRDEALQMTHAQKTVRLRQYMETTGRF